MVNKAVKILPKSQPPLFSGERGRRGEARVVRGVGVMGRVADPISIGALIFEAMVIVVLYLILVEDHRQVAGRIGDACSLERCDLRFGYAMDAMLGFESSSLGAAEGLVLVTVSSSLVIFCATVWPFLLQHIVAQRLQRTRSLLVTMLDIAFNFIAPYVLLMWCRPCLMFLLSPAVRGITAIVHATMLVSPTQPYGLGASIMYALMWFGAVSLGVPVLVACTPLVGDLVGLRDVMHVRELSTTRCGLRGCTGSVCCVTTRAADPRSPSRWSREHLHEFIADRRVPMQQRGEIRRKKPSLSEAPVASLLRRCRRRIATLARRSVFYANCALAASIVSPVTLLARSAGFPVAWRVALHILVGHLRPSASASPAIDTLSIHQIAQRRGRSSLPVVLFVALVVVERTGAIPMAAPAAWFLFGSLWRLGGFGVSIWKILNEGSGALLWRRGSSDFAENQGWSSVNGRLTHKEQDVDDRSRAALRPYLGPPTVDEALRLHSLAHQQTTMANIMASFFRWKNYQTGFTPPINYFDAEQDPTQFWRVAVTVIAAVSALVLESLSKSAFSGACLC